MKRSWTVLAYCASSTVQALWHCAQRTSWIHLEDSDGFSCQYHNQCLASKCILWTSFEHENQYPLVYASLSVDQHMSNGLVNLQVINFTKYAFDWTWSMYFRCIKHVRYNTGLAEHQPSIKDNLLSLPSRSTKHCKSSPTYYLQLNQIKL